MNWMEVALFILGIGAFAASFIIPERRGKNKEQSIDMETINAVIEKEMKDAKQRVSDIVDEAVEYAVEKTQRASDRISNEKMMAINEYSDTVLADVNKAHQEVMFLYDMLNDKHNNLKETVKKVDATAKEAQAHVNEAKEKAIDLEKQLAPKKSTTNKETREAFVADIKSMRETFNSNEKPEIKNDKKVSNFSFADVAPKYEKASEKEFVPLAPVVFEIIEEKLPEKENQPVQATKMEKAVSEIRSKQVVEVAEPEIEVENNNDKILRLSKLGMSSVDIAKELGLGVGEVKLVINLFKGVM